MKKEVIIVSLMLILLFITSCAYKPNAGETALESSVAVQKASQGTRGIEFKFLQDYPKKTMYDTTQLNGLVEIWNKGTYDLSPSECYLELIGYDKNIIKGVYHRQSCVSTGTLGGKTPYNLDGSYNQIEFKSSSIRLPLGVNRYTPTLNLVACYEYQTYANPLVCVENPLYQVSSAQKTCIVKDVSGSSGQGGPVSVSYVDVEMAGNKAIFAITVKNNGKGRVISPLTSLANCPNTLAYSDFDKVGYSVSMSGGNLISCKPEDRYVRLTNNVGKIICSFNVGNTAAYETPLMIDLDYNYMQYLKQQIQIIKTPGYS